MAKTSAFQADDEGSIPSTCLDNSIKGNLTNYHSNNIYVDDFVNQLSIL